MTEIVPLALPGLVKILPKKFGDDRGFFSEVYSEKALAAHGIGLRFVQDNHSLSRDAGVVRGLHYQTPPFAQDKLVRVVRGRILDVAVDIRTGSPTYGRHVAVELSADNWTQLLVPIGFLHGFCTLEPDTEVIYKVSNYYAPDCDRGIMWNDPDLAIDWPVAPEKAILSAKDTSQPAMKTLQSPFAFAP